MVLDKHRSSIDWWLEPLSAAFRRVNPDVFTWLSFISAIAGGVAFWQSGPERLGLLLAGWAGVLLNSVFDLMDGKIAKMTGKASPRGDYLDHAIDRFSDVALLTGIAFSPWVRVELGTIAVLATLLTSYMGTQAQAVGLKRNYGGLLGRADRNVLMLVVPLAMWAFESYGWSQPWTWWDVTLIEAMMGYFALMGILTTAQRFVAGLRGFGPDGRLKP